jgi:hypothetical protein
LSQDRYSEEKRHSSRNIHSVPQQRRGKLPRLSVVVFVVVLIYILVSVTIYMRTKKIVGYEVKTGSLSSSQSFTGMAIRTEEIVNSEYPGYVNYYNRDGDRLGVGSLAYTIDESGQIMEQLNAQNAGESLLSDSDYGDLKTQISDFASNFDPSSFSSVYSFYDSMDSSVQKLSNSYILKDISQLDSNDTNTVHKCYAKDTGIVVFSTDSDEGKTFDTVTADDFSAKTIAGYKSTAVENNQLVDTGSPVYKLSTDENWSVVIMTTPDNAKMLADLKYVKVRFLKDRREIWASVTTRDDGQGNSFVNLAFSNSMVGYVDDRYLKVELLTDEQKGLKVPNTSIVKSNFFVVPKEYLTVGTSGNKGVMREAYTQDGKKSVEFVTASPYSETDTSYYLDESTLQAGDVIDKPDSTDTYTLSEQAPLTGVYNINKGYADFREVEVLYSNNQYSIVQPNTSYGLSEYDYIVLDASSVTADTLVAN